MNQSPDVCPAVHPLLQAVPIKAVTTWAGTSTGPAHVAFSMLTVMQRQPLALRGRSFSLRHWPLLDP